MADLNDTHVVIAGLISHQDDRTIDRIIKRERQRLQAVKGKPAKEALTEIKFKSAGRKTRQHILTALRRVDVEIVVYVVEKRSAVIPDNAENYSELVWGVLENALARYPTMKIIIDSHFNVAERRVLFDQAMVVKAGRPLQIEHGDSRLNNRLGLADFVAGAMLREIRHGDAEFAELIRERIIVSKRGSLGK